MKKLLLILLTALSISASAQVKINQQETVELFPHTIDSGLGTEASPYINADSTAGVKTKMAILNAGRGGTIKFSASRFNIDSVIKITHSGIRMQSVVAGYNADSNAIKQGINGTTLICKKGGVAISGTGYPVGRTGGVYLSHLYFFGTKALQSVGSSTGTVGVQLGSYIDQATLMNVNMGGFDYGIKSVNSVSGWVDFGYYDQVEVQGGRVGAYYDNAGAGNFGQHFIKCAFAETKEHNFYVTSSSLNEYFVFTACAFYRGSAAAGVTNPSNVYFAGTRSRFEGCEFAQAGFNLLAGTHQVADGMILAGDYNTISGSAFWDNAYSGSCGLRISGNHNIVSGCIFNGNGTDIIITGNNNTVFVSAGTTVTDSGTGNTIITDHMILKPVVSSGSGAAQGMAISPSLTPTANNIPLIGLDISGSYVGGLGTIGIVGGGSSYTNGTYTSVALNNTTGSGGLGTVVVAGGAITSITVTTAGSGYKLGTAITILPAAIGGTGSGLVAYVTLLNFVPLDIAGLRSDGVAIGRGGGAGIQFGNIAIGLTPLLNNTLGGSAGSNVAIGDFAMKFNTTGSKNVALGGSSGTANTTGSSNSFIGGGSGSANTTGSNNTFVGFNSGASTTTHGQDTGIGLAALFASNADYNTSLGYSAGNTITSGGQNTIIGALAASGFTTGVSNTIMGYNTGGSITTGTKNTIIGASVAGLTSALSNNVILADGDGNMRFVSDASGNIYLSAATTYPTIPASSKFTIDNSTTKGTIPWTRMTTTQRTAISSPAEGLAVYDTDLHKLFVFDGTIWQAAW